MCISNILHQKPFNFSGVHLGLLLVFGHRLGDSQSTCGTELLNVIIFRADKTKFLFRAPKADIDTLPKVRALM